MERVEVGERVGKVGEAFKFVSDAFDLKTALVPEREDAEFAPFADGVVAISASSGWWGRLVGVGVGIGVGVGVGVGIRGELSSELLDELLLVGGVVLKGVELLFEMFLKLLM